MSTPAILHLQTCEPRLAEWIERLGVVQVPGRGLGDPYRALLESIAHQQLAGSAARAIWGRVLALFEDGIPLAERLVELSDEHLRGAGLSRSKVLAMKDLSAKALAGLVPDVKRIKKMSDVEIYEQLTAVRGVGPWTVDMLMIFTLRRPDVMPATDYGIQKGFQLLYRKRVMPTPKQLLKSTEKWSPHRSTAALYLWGIADSAKKPKSLTK